VVHSLNSLFAHLDLPIAPDTRVHGLEADSRKVEAGFVFFAIAGVAMDGAAFIPQALQKGAVLIVAEKGAKVPDEAMSKTLFVDNVRMTLAQTAKAFYAPQPACLMAITGTNGKTSVACFLRQIWALCGLPAASIGTTGLDSPKGHQPGNLTTPDPITLFRTFADLKSDGVEHVAMEASSHGLHQSRLEGVVLKAAGFTNLSRDHLDYHKGMQDYFAAKMLLFEKHLGKNAPAVVFADTAYGQAVMEHVSRLGHPVWDVGAAGQFITLKSLEIEGYAQKLLLEHEGKTYDVLLKLVGRFQAENALVAAGLALASGLPAAQVFAALNQIEGAVGRLQLGAQKPASQGGAGVFIDYAHTPDAVVTACEALKPFVTGRLICLLGAGGDRDAGKRPLMGQAAAEHADVVIVTDDNPRSEDPAAIRAQVMAGAGDKAIEIAGRANAILQAVRMAKAGDLVLLAGKGHETGQTITGVTHPFSDLAEAKKAVEADHDQ